MSNLAKALSAKAAFVKMKRTLSDAGIDITDVKYITDLPPVLAGILPEDMASQAAELLVDEETVTKLLEAFTGIADMGYVVSAFYQPGDDVKERDLFA